MNIAIIGAGLSGLTLARALHEQGNQVTLFEKSRGPAGRMSTRRTDAWFADHGAQYFTARTEAFSREVARWCEAGVAQRWRGRIRARQGNDLVTSESVERFVGTPRMTSPAAWLAQGLSLRTEQTVIGLSRDPSGWRIKTKEGDLSADVFDAVLFAIPAPQALAFSSLLPEAWNKRLQAVEFLPCWAVMARYEQSVDTEFDGLFANDEAVAWVSWNQSKPGRDETPVAVIHATAAYTQANLDANKEEVGRQLAAHLSQFGVPEPAEVVAHRWLYALSTEQASSSTDGAEAEGEICLSLWSGELRLGVCGDYLAGGRVEGAFLSGADLARRISATGSTS